MNIRQLIVLFLGISISNLALASKAVLVSDPSVVDDDNFGVVIKAVDGKLRNRGQIRLDGGTYDIVLQTTKETYGNRRPTMQGFSFEIKACTKYHLSAQHKHSYSDDWELQIREISAIPGCSTEDEAVSS